MAHAKSNATINPAPVPVPGAQDLAAQVKTLRADVATALDRNYRLVGTLADDKERLAAAETEAADLRQRVPVLRENADFLATPEARTAWTKGKTDLAVAVERESELLASVRSKASALARSDKELSDLQEKLRTTERRLADEQTKLQAEEIKATFRRAFIAMVTLHLGHSSDPLDGWQGVVHRAFGMQAVPEGILKLVRQYRAEIVTEALHG